VAREVSLGGSRALVTVAARTADGVDRYVTVPVARDGDGGLAVFGLPSVSPAPPRASADVGDQLVPVSRPDAGPIGDLARRFVRAYVEGADRTSLDYLLLPGARVVTMPGGLSVLSVDAVEQPMSAPGGRRRSLVVSVRVRDASTDGVYPLAYRLSVERRDRWYVAAVGGGPRV
jgi:hypothetical protein